MSKSDTLNEYQATIRGLSDRIVDAQTPIRVLDAIKWDDSIRQGFLKAKGKAMPAVDRSYYDSRPLAFDAAAKKLEFQNIERDITRHLGQFNPVGQIMRRMCKEYRMVIRMLEARGTADFGLISHALQEAAYPLFSNELRTYPHIRLTKRERECLKWAADGLTAPIVQQRVAARRLQRQCFQRRQRGTVRAAVGLFAVAGRQRAGGERATSCGEHRAFAIAGKFEGAAAAIALHWQAQIAEALARTGRRCPRTAHQHAQPIAQPLAHGGQLARTQCCQAAFVQQQ